MRPANNYQINYVQDNNILLQTVKFNEKQNDFSTMASAGQRNMSQSVPASLSGTHRHATGTPVRYWGKQQKPALIHDFKVQIWHFEIALWNRGRIFKAADFAWSASGFRMGRLAVPRGGALYTEARICIISTCQSTHC